MASIDSSIIENFKARFGTNPKFISSAPGRINLIGEHTDYNEGYVLPAAIDRRVTVIGAFNDSDTIQIYSDFFSDSVSFQPPTLEDPHSLKWGSYAGGVGKMLWEYGFPIPGLDLLVTSNIPTAAGLSSSAAFEVAIALAFLHAAGESWSSEEVVKLCFKTDNQMLGIKSGIMDQWISVRGKKGHAIFLDCRDLCDEQIPLSLGDYTFAVLDTRKPRALIESKYNERVEECRTGMREVEAFAHQSFRSLREVPTNLVQDIPVFWNTRVGRRCRHVLTENERVLESLDALRKGELEKLGTLLYKSHESLKTDYAVSCPELDTLVEIAAATDGVLGARMTGAGFGGSAIALVEKDKVDALRDAATGPYTEKYGRSPDIFAVEPSEGASIAEI